MVNESVLVIQCNKTVWVFLQSMKWDEDAFGRVYDLDCFHVVAVPYFNMGAMENKGLNIFNAACLLADRQVSTDEDFLGVMGRYTRSNNILVTNSNPTMTATIPMFFCVEIVIRCCWS